MPTTSDRRILPFPAVLRGTDGDVAECTVETWKEKSSAGKSYTRCRIAGDPPGLPDGEYTVHFAKQSVRTNKREGKWELTFLAPGTAIPGAA